MQNLNRIALTGLRAAEAVHRLGSLRAAAEELRVSVGAVSQQVARTEAGLGITLFERHPSGMRATPRGREICALLSTGFSQLDAAVALADPARARRLTISVAPILASRWLIWQLPDFSAAHPDIQVRIDAGTRLVDPATSDVDLAIRVGPGGWPGLRAERLFDQRACPVCSPALAARIRRPADLAHVPIIREPSPMFDWEFWLTPLGLGAEMLGDGPVFSDASLCLDAAVSGAGVFLAFEVLAAHALETGQLVAPLGPPRPTGLAYWLVTAPDRAPSPAQAAFRRWLKARLAAAGFGGT
jgi:DNA-binding transcriptional LysR family regulator